MQLERNALRLVIALLSLVLSTGCASMMETKPKGKATKENEKKSWFKKKEYQIPQSMNVTWAHDIISVPGKPPTRGFGGRIYFYNEKSQAIPVDGELMIYGFDDTHSNHSGATLASQGMDQADKRFRFTEEQFTTHFSESDLGASYSIWVPWDAAPGAKKKIMLIPTFKSKDGKVIRGNAATLLLPGWSEDGQDGQVIQATAIMPNGMTPVGSNGLQVNAGDLSLNNNPLDNRAKTTTIQMPARSASRVQPLLTPEQANELIEKARSGQIPSVGSLSPATTATSADLNLAPTQASQNNANQPMSLGPPTVQRFANGIDMNKALQAGPMPLFQMPTTGLSPSMLVPSTPTGTIGSPSSEQPQPSPSNQTQFQSPGQSTRF
jgi:hypothetical protein